jgi:hypothetical protein
MPAVLCAALICVGATPALAGPPGDLAGLQSDLNGQMQLAGSGSPREQPRSELRHRSRSSTPRPPLCSAGAPPPGW